MNKKIIFALALSLCVSGSVVSLNAATNTTQNSNTQTTAAAQLPTTTTASNVVSSNSQTNSNAEAQKSAAQVANEKELAAQVSRKREGLKVISKLKIWKSQKNTIKTNFEKTKPWLSLKSFNSWKSKTKVLGEQISRKNKGLDLISKKNLTKSQLKMLKNKFLDYKSGKYYSTLSNYKKWVNDFNFEASSLMRLNSGLKKINNRKLSQSRKSFFKKSFLANNAKVTKSLNSYNKWVKWFWNQPAVLSNSYHFNNCSAFSNGTFVDVNRSKQVLCAYINGKLAHGANVVTGDHSKGRDTPAGTWSIWNKSRNVTLVGSTVGHGADYNYKIPVKYWMPIDNTGVGLHSIDPDEVTGSWGRLYWGKDAYLTGRGSHGCVNMHTPDAAWVFEHMPLNTKVVVR